MKFLRLAKKNKELDAASWVGLYNRKIERKISERYSIGQELAILRQRNDKPEEFEAYNEYVEQCKAAVKAEMEIE